MKLGAWISVFALVLLPCALAQGPASGRGPESSTPSGGPPAEIENATAKQRPNTTSHPTGPPTDGPTTPTAPPVDVEDAKGGFGARPTDPESRRPAFSYNASRAEIALEVAHARVLDTALDAVLEFRDEDGDGAYDVGEPVVSRWALQDLAVAIEEDSSSVRTVTYGFPNGGALALRFDLRPAGALNATKFDITITAFPYAAADTRLAVATRVEATQGLHVAVVHGAPALVGTGTGSVPFLGWVESALVDGVPTSVASTVHLDANGPGAVLYWAYARGNVVHDPLLGMIQVSVPHLADPVAFSVAAAGGLILLAAGFEVRRRLHP